MESIGLYRLGKTIGKGSYGKVRLAVHSETGKQVAVKIVHYNSAKSKKQLEREIAIISRLQHPNIVQLHEVFKNNDQIYLILEYVGGGELFDYIMGRGRINEKMARKFFRQMVSAVGFCHKNGICHRDLKPENLILDEEGNVKINDFGLSNFFTPGSLLSSFCGSPVYAAPEIMAEKFYHGPAADIWSLGIVLYAMVVGQLPWKLDERGIIRDVNDLICAKFTIPPSAAISKDCEDLIRRMVRADPSDRLSMEEVARHPWVVKDTGKPVDFTGEVPLKAKSPRIAEIEAPRWRSLSLENKDKVTNLLSSSEIEDLAKARRGSHPENFLTKLIHKVTSKDKDKEKEKEKENNKDTTTTTPTPTPYPVPSTSVSTPSSPVLPVSSKLPGMHEVRGTFLLDVTTQLPPKQIIAEVSHALKQSKVEFTQEEYVFHCEGKVNVKSDTDSTGVSAHKLKFDIEICNIAGLHGLYGLHFRRVTGSTWLFRSLTIHLVDRMKL